MIVKFLKTNKMIKNCGSMFGVLFFRRSPQLMKTPVFPHMVALLSLSAIHPLTAQNSVGTPHAFEIGLRADHFDGGSDSKFSTSVVPADRYEVPATEKAPGSLPDAKPVFAAQDALTLNPRTSAPQQVESVVDMNVLRNPSLYRKVAVSASQPETCEADTRSLQKGLAGISAVYRESGRREKSADSLAVSLSVEQQVKLDVAKVLEIVESEVTANPNLSCEIVKAAISASDADVPLVVSIVQTAINVAPDSMRMISQCAIASMPESITAVQALLAKIDPNSGDAQVYSSKSAKSAKSAKTATIVAATPNPLDRFFMPVMTPIIPVRPVTEVNPSTGYRY